ncbi:unnamed protein product [Notodromas monacha]|uniref:Ste24 endopeptidase n=1 Tax=Notodromas monacha TaxID=399045 RepID=A0A7R9GDK5_9CRUS|nr:unnamed protein product [Notodromas monacha]CAG0917313.1 unnamed protein product [Notodromas monacha]
MVFTDLLHFFAAEEPAVEEDISEDELDLAEKLFFGIIAFVWLIYSWETFLSLRQRKVYQKNPTVPVDLETVMDAETFQKARLYEWDKCSFSLLKDFISQIITTVLLVWGMLPYAWEISGETFRRGLIIANVDPTPFLTIHDPDDFEVEYDEGTFLGALNIHGEIGQSIVCLLLMSVFSRLIDLPFSIYKTFVLEERHGFNRQTPWFFAKDKLKAFIVDLVITVPITVGVLYIIHAGGELFFVYLWGFCCVVSLFLMAIYPSVIAPLFDKYTVLPEGPLKVEIEAMASKVKFPLKKLYIVEGSKRSAHSNAYFYGLFSNKRIVLYDTLVADYTPLNKADEGKEAKGPEKKLDKDKENSAESETNVDSEEAPKKTKGCKNFEVVAILCHELGHWKKSHILFHIVFGQVNLFLMFALFAMLYRQPLFFYAFGFIDEQPLLISLVIILQFVFMPYHALLGFLMSVVSRKFEFQADRYAAELGHASGLRSGLVKLNLDNLNFPIYDWMYSAWHHSHPTLLQRLDALKKFE